MKLTKDMKEWIKNNDCCCWELHFHPYNNDEILLKFCVDKNDHTCFWYVSDLLNVEEDCIWANSIEDAKEDFEYKISEYYQDQINYYDELLDKFEEDLE